MLAGAGVVVGAAEVVLASADDASAEGGAAGVITASVSCTGRTAGIADAVAASGAVTLFRVARYPPAPAAPIQAEASAAKVRRFETMSNLSPSGTDTS